MEETEGITRGPVVVTGAAGYVGSWLVMRLLQRGYSVRATVRDPTNQEKVKPLLGFPRSKELLTIWRADLAEEGSFDEVVDGCTGVFHVATPTDFESEDPENEVIKPTVDGVLSLMRSCKKAGTVKRVVFTSSAATVNLAEQPKPEYDETSWSDLDFLFRTKMTAWMYFAAKTLAEKAALDFAEENSLHLISIIPSLVVGPFISSSMPPSLDGALALITGNEVYYAFLSQMSFVHLDDLCNAHIFLFEHPDASGRFICSSHDYSILALAEMLNKRYPEYEVPTKFDDIDHSLPSFHLSSKKLQGLGFEYRYSLEEMFDEAIRCCREKKMLPLKKTEGPRDDAEERETEKKSMT